MQKLKFYHFILPTVLVAGVVGCNQEKPSAISRLEIPGISFATDLREFVPEKSLKLLKYDGSTEGQKFAHPGVGYVSYFEYAANEADVLAMLAVLPFSKYAVVADTIAYKVDIRMLEFERQKATAEEIEIAHNFWNASPNEYTAYECRKFPWRHVVLVNNKTNQVLHRIEHKA